ncbi:TIGR01212 family radical SAM protein, partial [Photobacterium sanctipauli]
DCVPDEVLELLASYHEQGYEIWLELGLQTANDKTLKRINRGHDFACYEAITKRARALGLKVCAHLIVGLPGDTKEDNLETIRRTVAAGVDGIKLHPLHIVEGSIMGLSWKAGRLSELTLEQYTDIASEMIRLTPPDVVFHRVSASARKPTLLAPEWCENRWLAMTDIGRNLDSQGAQGSAVGEPFVYQPIVRKG